MEERKGRHSLWKDDEELHQVVTNYYQKLFSSHLQLFQLLTKHRNGQEDDLVVSSDDWGVEHSFESSSIDPLSQERKDSQSRPIGLSQNFTLQSCSLKLLKISLRKIQIILQGNACWVVGKSSLSCEEIVGEEAGRGVGSNLDRGRRKNAGTLLITLSASHTYTAGTHLWFVIITNVVLPQSIVSIPF